MEPAEMYDIIVRHTIMNPTSQHVLLSRISVVLRSESFEKLFKHNTTVQANIANTTTTSAIKNTLYFIVQKGDN